MKNLQASRATYVIVGGGTTGCIVASRLSEDPAATVILIEEGPRDSSPYIRFPGTYYKTAQGDLLKRYRWETAPGYEREENDTMVQASVLGGGSSVNGMVYVRGNPADYDSWEAAGARGWSYRDVLPYFRRAESNSDFANEQHGTDGPIGISFPASVHPLTRKWLQACQQSGLSYVPDFNGGMQDGCGLYQVAVKDGLRSSSARAYLRPAEKRGNLTVLVGAKVLRILVDKQRAVGVEYVMNGEKMQAFADNEVVVSSGTINTPKLLMLSGIGHAPSLEKHNIQVHAHVPGVGLNLQDHLEMSLVYQLKAGSDSYDKFKSRNGRRGLLCNMPSRAVGLLLQISLRVAPFVEEPKLTYRPTSSISLSWVQAWKKVRKAFQAGLGARLILSMCSRIRGERCHCAVRTLQTLPGLCPTIWLSSMMLTGWRKVFSVVRRS